MKIKTDPKELYRGVNCLETGCLFRKTCANHASAGDFRSEGGFSPELHLRRGEVYCDTVEDTLLPIDYENLPSSFDKLNHGAVLWTDLVETVENYNI